MLHRLESQRHPLDDMRPRREVESALALIQDNGATSSDTAKLESKLKSASRQIDRLRLLVNNVLDRPLIAGGHRGARDLVGLRSIVSGSSRVTRERRPIRNLCPPDR